MKCPACHCDLSAEILGEIELDVCREGCGGIWFDAFELASVSKPGQEEIQSDVAAPNPVVDQNRKRACPRCPEVKMQRHFYSTRQEIAVDSCPGCGGVWLDAGELEAVRTQGNKPSDMPRYNDYRCLSQVALRSRYAALQRVPVSTNRSYESRRLRAA